MSAPRLNVPIPEQLNEFIAELIKSGLYTNKTEYIRYLIREDYKKNRDAYPEMKSKKTSTTKASA